MVCKVAEKCGQNCSGHCALNTGYSLAKFLHEVDRVESSIGELVKASSKKGDYLLVTGMQVDSAYNPARILGSAQSGISRAKKFSNPWGVSTSSLLRDCCKIAGIPNEAELGAELTALESYKMLLTPIKPGMQCEVYVEEPTSDGQGTTLKKKHSVIEYIKWATNSETKQVECFIITEVIEANANKRARVAIEDYGKLLLLTDLERSLSATAEKAHKLVHMTNFGAIQPIEVTTGKGNSLVLDNTYLYSVTFDQAMIVASWEGTKLVGDKEFQRISKNSLYKLIQDYLPYIVQHRKYIAPYGVVNTNIVHQDELVRKA